ncbi:hypothetical protein NPIL_170131 [Nephila pilipes]|uniref:Uncharacterized protein n=1 Tax=Nephila pilipes TaxID=299642 RepID=A0A8X6NVQ7_NEPPI|nr:hypothetical protein NPIL_170131 [Nephila pilipes]
MSAIKVWSWTTWKIKLSQTGRTLPPNATVQCNINLDSSGKDINKIKVTRTMISDTCVIQALNFTSVIGDERLPLLIRSLYPVQRDP